MVLHAAVGFIYLVSGLVAPLWGVALLIVLWIALTIVLVHALRQRDPWIALGVPVTGGVLWIAVVQGLGYVFDWTA